MNSIQPQVEEVPTRDESYRFIMRLYKPFLMRFPDTNMKELLLQRYGVDEVRLMTIEQVANLLFYMRNKMGILEVIKENKE